MPEFLEKVRKQNIPNAESAILSIAESIAEKVRVEATAKGKAEGLRRGSLIGQIQALERVLKRSGSSEATLDELNADQLSEKIAALEREIHLA